MVGKISQQTVRALLDVFASSWSVRTIENLFVDAGIVPVADAPESDGVRRSTAMQYIHGLDLDSARDKDGARPPFSCGVQR